jgi:hypothetical protein
MLAGIFLLPTKRAFPMLAASLHLKANAFRILRF